MRLVPRLLLLSTLAFSLPAEDAKPPLKDDWFVVYVRGQPAGHSHVRESISQNGDVETVNRMRLKVARGKEVAEMILSMTTREDARGRVLDFVTMQDLGQSQSITTRGRVVDNDQLMLEILSSGVKGKTTKPPPRPFDPKPVGPHYAGRAVLARLKKKGDSLEQTVFAQDVLRCSSHRSVCLGPSKTRLPNGEERVLLGIRNDLDVTPGFPTTNWYDDEGHMIKSSLPAMQIEIVRSTRQKVLGLKLTSPPEIFLASAVHLAKPLPQRRDRLTYRLRPKNESGRAELQLDFDEAETPAGHHFSKSSETGAWTVRVETVVPRRSVARPHERTAALAKFLDANVYIESDDAEIRALAKKIVGDETKSTVAAMRLESWVFRNVRSKNLETAFATAKQVLRSREGDCTEHAVLLAALARAAGIPSRVVAGLTYHRKRFVGHMWTEVWVGEWMPLDATIGRGRVSADHIAFATSALDSASIGDLFLGLVPIFAGVDLELVEADERK